MLQTLTQNTTRIPVPPQVRQWEREANLQRVGIPPGPDPVANTMRAGIEALKIFLDKVPPAKVGDALASGVATYARAQSDAFDGFPWNPYSPTLDGKPEKSAEQKQDEAVIREWKPDASPAFVEHYTKLFAAMRDSRANNALLTEPNAPDTTGQTDVCPPSFSSVWAATGPRAVAEILTEPLSTETPPRKTRRPVNARRLHTTGIRDLNANPTRRVWPAECVERAPEWGIEGMRRALRAWLLLRSLRYVSEPAPACPPQGASPRIWEERKAAVKVWAVRTVRARHRNRRHREKLRRVLWGKKPFRPRCAPRTRARYRVPVILSREVLAERQVVRTHWTGTPGSIRARVARAVGAWYRLREVESTHWIIQERLSKKVYRVRMRSRARLLAILWGRKPFARPARVNNDRLYLPTFHSPTGYAPTGTPRTGREAWRRARRAWSIHSGLKIDDGANIERYRRIFCGLKPFREVRTADLFRYNFLTRFCIMRG